LIAVLFLLIVLFHLSVEQWPQFRVYISVVFFSSKDYLKRGSMLKRGREMEADSMTEIEHVGGKGRE
jgi:hypothetical protein